jgi:hypothetical protein
MLSVFDSLSSLGKAISSSEACVTAALGLGEGSRSSLPYSSPLDGAVLRGDDVAMAGQHAISAVGEGVRQQGVLQHATQWVRTRAGENTACQGRCTT